MMYCEDLRVIEYHNDILLLLKWFLYLNCRKVHTLCKDITQVPRRYPKCLVIPNKPISFKTPFDQLIFVFHHPYFTTQHLPPTIRLFLLIKFEIPYQLRKPLSARYASPVFAAQMLKGNGLCLSNVLHLKT
jgi:hypothetical protein